MKTIGERIKSIRVAVEMTQNEFSDALGVNRAHISKIERNVAKPSPLLIKFISKLSGTNETWLATGQGHERSKGEWSKLSDDEIVDRLEELKKIPREAVLSILEECIECLEKADKKTIPIILGSFKFKQYDVESKILLKRMKLSIDSLNSFITNLSKKE